MSSHNPSPHALDQIQSAPATGPGLIQLTVAEVERLTPRSVHLIFDELPNSPVYSAGQYLTLVFDCGAERRYRSYSLTSVPGVDTRLAVVVKRTAGGAISNFLNDVMYPGARVTTTLLAGRFSFTPDARQSRHLVLIGGGSGITPLYAMLRSALHFEPASRVTLIYANVTEEEIIFREQLQALEQTSAGRLQIIHFLEQPSPHFSSLVGRPDAARLEAVLKTATAEHPQHATYYLCGPEPMMAQGRVALQVLQVPEHRIFLERFVVDQHAPTPAAQARTLRLTLGGEHHTVTVAPGKSVLDAVEQAGLFLPYSCRNGECGSCKCLLLHGAVTTTSNEGLTLVEEQEGYILTCVAYPNDDEVELEAPF